MTDEVRTAAELEAEARAINATNWDPPPGMVKRQCPWYFYFFAAPADSHEPRCPDCVKANSPPRTRATAARTRAAAKAATKSAL